MAKATNEEFVQAWMSCGTIKEVAARTGLKPSGVTSRAAWMRMKGVKLPKLSKGPTPLDVDALNKLIKQNGTHTPNQPPREG